MIFPTNFLWGASTSAFQVEGGYNEGGKGVATTDLGARRPGIADNKVAADHYHHWKEDVDLMAELGLKVYRMGFSWSRIMPDASGQSNPEGLAFYDKLIDYLLEKGIEPLVTLYHFECPQALVDAPQRKPAGKIICFIKSIIPTFLILLYYAIKRPPNLFWKSQTNKSGLLLQSGKRRKLPRQRRCWRWCRPHSTAETGS